MTKKPQVRRIGEPALRSSPYFATKGVAIMRLKAGSRDASSGFSRFAFVRHGAEHVGGSAGARPGGLLHHRDHRDRRAVREARALYGQLPHPWDRRLQISGRDRLAGGGQGRRALRLPQGDGGRGPQGRHVRRQLGGRAACRHPDRGLPLLLFLPAGRGPGRLVQDACAAGRERLAAGARHGVEPGFSQPARSARPPSRSGAR